MIRNLFYAIFFHLILFFIVYFGYINKHNQPYELINDYREFISENDIDIKGIDKELIQEIKSNIGKRKHTKKYKNLSLNEKLDLYNKVKLKEKKFLDKNKVQAVISEELKDAPENIFYYIEKPIYISKNRLSKVELDNIKKFNEIKKEIRDQIKARNMEIPLADNVDTREYSIEEIIKMSQKPVVIQDKLLLNRLIINNIEEVDYDKIAEILFGIKDDNENVIFSKKEIELIKPNEIFTKKDWGKFTEGYKLNQRMKTYELTAYEKSNIQKQIRYCYKKAIVNSDIESSIIIDVIIKIDRDGYIDMNNIRIEDDGIYDSEEDYQKSIDNVKTALVFCNPLQNLPAKKYIIWNELSFTFDNQNVQ